MLEDFVETEMSKKAREYFQENVYPESPAGRDYKSLKFNKEFREKLSTPDGILDYSKVYKTLGVENQEFVLIKRCVELNLTQQEVHKIIKERFKTCYNRQDKSFALPMYKDWCKRFGIEPDSGFHLPERSNDFL